MAGLPSLDLYDLQGVRPEETALYGDDIRYALDDLDPMTGVDGFSVIDDYTR